MSDPPTSWGAGWRRWEALWLGLADARVYGWMRIAFATVALVNVIDLWPHRLAFFSDSGMVGRPAEKECLSLIEPLVAPFAVTTGLVAAALAAVWLGWGVMARPAISILFLWQMFYTCRGYPMVHGWDILLRIQAFILLVSPLGPSLPELLGRSGAARRVLAPRHGLVLTQIQLAVVYWQTVWLKGADIYWRSGEFFSHFMMSLHSRFPSAAWARREVASAVMSHATLLVELAIPLLLWNRHTRLWGFLVGFGLHLSIMALSHIVMFSLAVLVPYVAFLEGSDLDRLGAGLRRHRSRAG